MPGSEMTCCYCQTTFPAARETWQHVQMPALRKDNGWTMAIARDRIRKIDQIAKNPKPQSCARRSLKPPAALPLASSAVGPRTLVPYNQVTIAHPWMAFCEQKRIARKAMPRLDIAGRPLP